MSMERMEREEESPLEKGHTSVLGKTIKSLALFGILMGGASSEAEEVPKPEIQNPTAASQEYTEDSLEESDSETHAIVHIQMESDDRPEWDEVADREKRKQELEKYVRNIDPNLSLGESKTQFLGNVEAFGLFFEDQHLGDILPSEGEKTLSYQDFLSEAIRILDPYMSAGGKELGLSVITTEENEETTSIVMEVSLEPLDIPLSVSEESEKVLEKLGWKLAGTNLLVASTGSRQGMIIPFPSSEVKSIAVTGSDPEALEIVFTMVDKTSESIVVGENGAPRLEK